MDEVDALVGFWVKDVPYVFERSAKRDEDGVKESQRKYLISYPELGKLQTDSCSWAARYFETNNSGWLKTIMAMVRSVTPNALCNGRSYYYLNENKLSPPFEVTVPDQSYFDSELSERLSAYNGVFFDLSSLICTQMATTSAGDGESASWDDILDLMKRCPPISECDPCTKVGTKVAKSLIKIAALRIFADPEQSIMELPVNSLDAYNPNRKIGKFGMGFFSILYWLVGHPKRFFEFHSFAKGRDGRYVTFSVRIQEHDGALGFMLTAYPQSRIATTGFRAVLDATDDKFTIDQEINFLKQLSKLDYVTGATIYKHEGPFGRFDFRDAHIINPGTGKNIFCFIDRSALIIEDFATGIPYEIVFGSLFVPSISTKTIQMTTALPFLGFDNKSRIVKGTGLRSVVFLIGGIAVVSISEPKCKPDTYVIDLPSTTRLPVSRDDFILDDKTEAVLLESIAIVFEAARQMKDVSCFQSLLEKYIAFTPSAENKRVVRRAMNTFFSKTKGQLIPLAYSQIYKLINDDFVVSQTYDISAIEEWLDANTKPDRGIWYGTKVLMVKGLAGNTSDGGLVSYLFIDESYKNKLGAGWISTITSSVFGRKLYPIGSSYGEKEYAKYENILVYAGKLPSKIIKNDAVRNYYFAVLNKLESLEDRFDISRDTLAGMAHHLLDIFLFIPEESFLDILTELMAKFSSFKGNQTYGGGKYQLSYAHSGFSSNSYLKPAIVFTVDGAKVPYTDKRITYTVSQIIYAIRAIKEENSTKLVTLTENCIWSVSNRYATRAPDFFDELMVQSENFAEFQLVVGGAGRAYTQQWLPTKLKIGDVVKTGQGPSVPREITRQIVSHFLDKIRFHQHGVRDVIDVYGYWDNKTPEQGPSTFIYMVKDREEAIEWLKTAQGISNIPEGSELVAPKGTGGKSLSAMIRKLFVTDLPSGASTNVSALADEKAFYSSIPRLGGKEGTSLQIIEIAVNEGTVKPFIEATMTESVQNSIDAVREFKPKNTTIDINLIKTKAGDKVVLSITDRVGMTRDAFVYIGVPFLSTKTPSELVTGEMGSGFFNSYRESDVVKIDTIRDGTSRVSIDTPVRAEGGRVIDIVKDISIGPSSLDNQTKISIQIPTPTEAHYANAVSRAVYTATNVLGLAMAENIRFNGANVYVKRTLVAKFGYFELYSTNSSDLKHESFLLTKGVPFAPLGGYFKGILSDRVIDVISRNLILNITHGGYTPVQTRTRINLAPEVEKDFRKAAIYAVFVTMVRELAQNERLYALDHINSVGDPRQLKFTSYKLDNSMMSYAEEPNYLKYVSFYDQPTLADLINMCITTLGKNVLDMKARTELVKEKYNSPYPFINDRILTIVNRWFQAKKFIDTPGKGSKPKSPRKPTKVRKPDGGYGKMTIPGLKELLKAKKLKVGGNKPDLIKRLEEYDATHGEMADDEDDDSDVPDPEFTNVINTWVKIYWQLASAAKIKGFVGAAPQCKAVKSEKDQSVGGYFTPGIKTITINTVTWTEKDRVQILSVLKKKNIEDFTSGVLKNNKAWERWFSYSIPSSTLPHELEHARRGTDHDAGGHDSSFVTLFPGDSPHTRTFNECANLAFEKALAAGFYEKFLKALTI